MNIQAGMIRFRFKNLVISTIFILIYWLSGLLYLSPIPYRMASVSLLSLPTIIKYRPRLNRTIVLYGAILFTTIISAILNETSIVQLLFFLRIPLVSCLIYLLVLTSIDSSNYTQYLRWYLILSLIQLPTMLLQWRIYSKLPASLLRGIDLTDFGFGTFNVATDYAMTFFFVALTTWLLFETKLPPIVKRMKWGLITWALLTVMVANAQVSKIAIIIILIGFAVFRLYIHPLRLATLIIILIFSWQAVQFVETLGGKQENYSTIVIDRILSVTEQVRSGDTNRSSYLSGEYDRVGALLYFVEQGITWFGDGPSAYQTLDFSFLRGNRGHIYRFYSELGFIGLLLSWLVYASVIFPKSWSRRSMFTPRLLLFLCLVISSFVYPVMNDASFNFTYFFFIKLLGELPPAPRL